MKLLKNRKNKFIFIFILLSFGTIVSLLLFNSSTDNTSNDDIFRKQDIYYTYKCNCFLEENKQASKNQIVFVGDSNVELFQLDNYFDNSDLKVYNRGIGGDTTLSVLGRLKLSVFDLDHSIVVINVGNNDLLLYRNIEDIVLSYATLINEIKTNLPNTKIYCMSVFPINEKCNSDDLLNIDLYNHQVTILNQNLQVLCQNYQTTYVDLYSNVVDENLSLNINLTDDGLHLNKYGFTIWADLMKSYWNK